MTESLGSVAQLLAAARNLLGEHAQVVGEAQHALKEVDRPNQVLGLVDGCAGHGFDEPEGAHAECALVAAYS